MKCYFHPKLDAHHSCHSCGLPVCPHCLDGVNCPQCTRRIRYAQRGVIEPARLAPQAAPRSITKDLILARLHEQAAPQVGSPTWVPPVQGDARKATNYGFLMPGVSPRLRATRRKRSVRNRVLAGTAAVVLAVVGLVLHERMSWAEVPSAVATPVALAPSPSPAATATPDAATSEERIWAPAKASTVPTGVTEHLQQAVARTLANATLPARAPAGATMRPLPRVAPGLVLRPVVAAAIAPAAHPAPQVIRPVAPPVEHLAADGTPMAVCDVSRPPAPTVAMTWPVMGNTVRYTPYVKVAVAHHEDLAHVRLEVDGREIGTPVPATGKVAEIPWDTTVVANGDHVLKVVGVARDGRIVSSGEVPVTVSN